LIGATTPPDAFHLLATPILDNARCIRLIKAERLAEKAVDFSDSDIRVIKSLALAVSAEITGGLSRKDRNKKYIFVLMPFSEEFDDIYQFGTKECAINLGMS
jgi:hypothetical protein